MNIVYKVARHEPQIYYVGYLFRDRQFDRDIHDLARKVWRRYEKGEVYLFQRRLNDYMYEYYYQETRRHGASGR
jgi:hypothetical protein|tara:strand:+ start:272 stop:493 length:222 start_codon:yes stop_codon:yes gene_type:complete